MEEASMVYSCLYGYDANGDIYYSKWEYLWT